MVYVDNNESKRWFGCFLFSIWIQIALMLRGRYEKVNDVVEESEGEERFLLLFMLVITLQGKIVKNDSKIESILFYLKLSDQK